MDTIYEFRKMRKLALMLGCTPKPEMTLEKPPKTIKINSRRELSDLMRNFFNKAHDNPGINEVVLNYDPALAKEYNRVHDYDSSHDYFELREDVDGDGIKDLAFEAGLIAYKDGYSVATINYAIHSSELPENEKIVYQADIEQFIRNGRLTDGGADLCRVKFEEMHLKFPLIWHLHGSLFCGR